jgi:hypothetical protein
MDAVGFRLSFTPLAGVLFTVPSRYSALSVTTSRLPWRVGPPASHGLARGPWYSRSRPPGQAPAIPDSHRLWCAIPDASGRSPRHAAEDAPSAAGLTTPSTQRVHAWHVLGLGSGPFRSPLLRAVFRFLRLLRCFSSPGALPPATTGGCPAMLDGLPHSETDGSPAGCASPSLSLLARVLHRLVVPRHPPTAHHVLPGLWLSSAAHAWCADSVPGTTALVAPFPYLLFARYSMQLFRCDSARLRPLTCDLCWRRPPVGWTSTGIALEVPEHAAMRDCVEACAP